MTGAVREERRPPSPYPTPGYAPLRLHTAPGVLATVPGLDAGAAAAVRSSASVSIYRPGAPTTVFADMAGDLGASYGRVPPRPDLTAVVLAAVLDRAGLDVQVSDRTGVQDDRPFDPDTDLVALRVALPTWRSDVEEATRLSRSGHRVALFGAAAPHVPLPTNCSVGVVTGDAPTAVAAMLDVSDIEIGRAYGFFPLDSYRDTQDRVLAHLHASRGCSRTCLYCPYIRNFGRWASRDPERVGQDAAAVVKLGAQALQLRDQDFPSDHDHAVAVTHELGASVPGVPWAAEGNLDRFHDALLDEMAGAGCEEIIVGLESADIDVLRGSRRKVLREAEERVAAIRSRGIRIRGLFVIGLPGDNPTKALRTLDWARVLELDAAQFNAYSPLPGEAFGTDRPANLEDFRPFSNDYRYKTCHDMSRSMVTWAAATCQRAFDTADMESPGLLRLRRLAQAAEA